jgi:hypothetical protein
MGASEIERMAGMADRYRRPDWVRRLNGMGDSFGGSVAGARRLVPLDADELLEAASADLGGGELSDFGDPRWRERFQTLVQAVDDAPMHVVGRLMTKQEILRGLRTRLLLARRWGDHPEIASETIEAPVVVTGPARSGTSILFELLWLDPGLRGPVGWEVLHPIPLEADDAGEARRAWSECEQELWADVQPEFAAIHELRSDLPVECITLSLPSFCGPHWSMVGVGFETDLVENYAFEKRLLQVLQCGDPGTRWLLKTPGHLMTIDQLFATFPDAWVVQTHRDPAKTMPSTVSTTAMVQWLRTDQVDLARLAAGIGAGFSHALNSVTQRRAQGDLPERFVDVHFQQLMSDPVETLRRAYASMERDFTQEHGERIARYLADKPRGKFGVHQYTPEEWGFTKQELREGLAPYIEGFGVALED